MACEQWYPDRRDAYHRGPYRAAAALLGRVVHRASTEYDVDKRKALTDAAQKIVWNDAYWIFLWRAAVYAGLSERIDYDLRPDDYVEIYLAKPRS